MTRSPEHDERLADWVDGRLSERDLERFEAELRVNAELRAAAERYRSFVERVSAEFRGDPAADDAPVLDAAARSAFADRVLAGVDEVAPAPARRGFRFLPGLLSAAAAVVLVGGFWWLRSLDGASAPEVATETASVARPPKRGLADDGRTELRFARPDQAGRRAVERAPAEAEEGKAEDREQLRLERVGRLLAGEDRRAKAAKEVTERLQEGLALAEEPGADPKLDVGLLRTPEARAGLPVVDPSSATRELGRQFDQARDLVDNDRSIESRRGRDAKPRSDGEDRGVNTVAPSGPPPAATAAPVITNRDPQATDAPSPTDALRREAGKKSETPRARGGRGGPGAPAGRYGDLEEDVFAALRSQQPTVPAIESGDLMIVLEMPEQLADDSLRSFYARRLGVTALYYEDAQRGGLESTLGAVLAPSATENWTTGVDPKQTETLLDRLAVADPLAFYKLSLDTSRQPEGAVAGASDDFFMGSSRARARRAAPKVGGGAANDRAPSTPGPTTGGPVPPASAAPTTPAPAAREWVLEPGDSLFGLRGQPRTIADSVRTLREFAVAVGGTVSLQRVPSELAARVVSPAAESAPTGGGGGGGRTVDEKPAQPTVVLVVRQRAVEPRPSGGVGPAGAAPNPQRPAEKRRDR